MIRTNLRQCDVGARYTDMQYVVMLSGSTAESGTSPLERIKAAFYRIPAHGRYLLSYSLYVPEPRPTAARPPPQKDGEEGKISEPLSRTVKAVRLFLLHGPAKKRLVGAGIARPCPFAL